MRLSLAAEIRRNQDGGPATFTHPTETMMRHHYSPKALFNAGILQTTARSVAGSQVNQTS